MPSKSNTKKKSNNNNSNNNNSNKKELVFTIQNDQANPRIVKEIQNNHYSPQKPSQNNNKPQVQSPISPSNKQQQQIPVEKVEEKVVTKNIEENKQNFEQVEKKTTKEEEQPREDEENDSADEENNQTPEQQLQAISTLESLRSKGFILVFDDPLNYNVKHPLKSKWTFWFDKPSKNRSKEWGDHLEKIYTFEYIEDFWRLYNNIPLVSKLANQSNYHLFKEGIVPKWEDPMNENGGRWMFHVEKASRQIDNYFLRAMMACIGEQITSNDDEVCGVVATVKHSEDRISLWCYSTPEESSVTRMCGHQFKKLLEVPNECKIYFQTSKDGISGGRAIPSQLNYIV